MNKKNTEIQKSACEKNKEYSHRRIETIFSGIIALTTIGTLIAYIIVGISQNNQTRKSLKSIERSNELARRNYIEENRPYVYPNNPTVIEKPNGYNTTIACLPIINYGHTPAYRVYESINFQLWDSIDDPRTYTYDTSWSTKILAPNSIDTIKLSPWNARWNTSKWGRYRYYIVGKIWYSDNWNSRPHYTTFAYEWISLHTSSIRHYEYESADTSEQSQADN